MSECSPLFQKLVEKMGERSAFRHIERILCLHMHSSSSISNDSPAALMPWRASELELFARLLKLKDQWCLPLRIVDVAKLSHRGDVIVSHVHPQGDIISLWDSKAYKRAVPWSQVRKLARDVRLQRASFGVIVAEHGVARMPRGCRRKLCDGIPIHVCKPRSPGEFACLYLTTITTQEQRIATANSAQVSHLFTIVEQMQSNINELKNTLTVSANYVNDK
jgi:hypothetical protein